MEQIPTQPFGTGIVPPPPVPVNPSSRTKFTTGQRKTGFLVKIIGVVIVLGIVSGGAILAARIWDPVWSPFRPSPEKVITAMAEKMKAVKSSHSEVKINIDMKSPSPGKVVISFSGDSDINDPENIKAEGVFGISFTGQLFGTSAETISAKLNIKIIDAEGYVNISELNAPSLTPFLMMMGIDLNNVVGNWIKFPTELIENQLSQNVDVQAAATEQMQKIISESKIYIVKQQLADQTIEGQKMYHYLVALDNEKTAKLIGDLMAEATKQSGSDQAGAEIGGLLASGAAKGMISEFLNKIGEINAELLIGKNDNLLYGLKTEKSIDLSKIDSASQGLFDIILEVNNSKFNQPVKVEAPAGYKSFEEIITPPTSPAKQPGLQETGGRQKMIDKLVHNMIALQKKAKSIYGEKNSYISLSCFYKDIKPICDEIKIITGKNLIINRSKNDFCFYVELPQIGWNKGESWPYISFYCLSSGEGGHLTSVNPTGEGYCTEYSFKCPLVP